MYIMYFRFFWIYAIIVEMNKFAAAAEEKTGASVGRGIVGRGIGIAFGDFPVGRGRGLAGLAGTTVVGRGEAMKAFQKQVGVVTPSPPRPQSPPPLEDSFDDAEGYEVGVGPTLPRYTHTLDPECSKCLMVFDKIRDMYREVHGEQGCRGGSPATIFRRLEHTLWEVTL